MPDLPFPTDLAQFAVWLGSAGAGGIILSLLLERWPAFKNWQSPAKGYCVMGLFVALPFVGEAGEWAIRNIDPAVLAQVQAALGKILLALGAWTASQFAHAKDPAK